MKATDKTRKATATKGSKSATNKSAKQTKSDATANKQLVDETVNAILKDSKATTKSGKKQPTAEDIAAKQRKDAIRRRDKVTDTIVANTFKKVLSIQEWLKAAKAEAAKEDPQFAKQIDAKWATLCVEMKKADSYYAVVTIVTDPKDGKKKSMISYIPVEWKNNDKIVIPCRKGFTPTEYRFNSDCIAVSIKKSDDLAIKHKVLVNKPITKVIDGQEWKKDNFVEVEKTFRPVELTEFTPSQFKKRFKLAMQVVFPDGFAVESK